MNKTTIIIFLFLPLISWCQVKISGIVYAKSDNLGVPGAQIIEKGTSNGTATNMKGEFELIVADKNAILNVLAVGYQPKELIINDKTTFSIYIKEDCNKDWFDLNKIGFGFLSGLVNTPYGGQFNFSFPMVKVLPVVKIFASYQTDFKSNSFLNGNVGFYHLFSTCDFDADINFNYKSLKFNQHLDLSTYNFSSNFNFRKFGIITGLGRFSDRNEQSVSYGPVLGFKTRASIPLWIDLSAKSAFNKQFIETNVEANRSFKSINTFVRFYSIKGCNELTIGIGKEFYYHLKR